MAAEAYRGGGGGGPGWPQRGLEVGNGEPAPRGDLWSTRAASSIGSKLIVRGNEGR